MQEIVAEVKFLSFPDKDTEIFDTKEEPKEDLGEHKEKSESMFETDDFVFKIIIYFVSFELCWNKNFHCYELYSFPSLSKHPLNILGHSKFTKILPCLEEIVDRSFIVGGADLKFLFKKHSSQGPVRCI